MPKGEKIIIIILFGKKKKKKEPYTRETFWTLIAG